MQRARAYISVSDYLAGELRSPIKHEYVDGEVYAMVGASRRHNLLVTNLLRLAANAALKRPPCQVFAADMKVRVEADNAFYYPDVSGSCDPDDREEYFLTRPCFIVEVLSPATAAIDRREKRLAYRTLASLKEYVVVDQDRRRVDVYCAGDGGWHAETLTQSGTFELSCLGLRLSLDQIYQGVELPHEVAEAGPAYASASASSQA
ncbi:MAG: Uma2 family endonuclease [Gammaproteobacteria bacterium]|nr:Uma2 family endonuclease [Gammaproteobacteria bacterium]